jgi:hypothetical protein
VNGRREILEVNIRQRSSGAKDVIGLELPTGRPLAVTPYIGHFRWVELSTGYAQAVDKDQSQDPSELGTRSVKEMGIIRG